MNTSVLHFKYKIISLAIAVTFISCRSSKVIFFSPVNESLKIVTYNVQMMPSLFGTDVCCDEIPDREEKLAERINASDFDIIALEEVWSNTSRDLLVTLLKEKYPHYIKYVDADELELVQNDAGLMLFSKFPFINLPNETFIVDDDDVMAKNGDQDRDGIEDDFKQVAFKVFDDEIESPLSPLHGNGIGDDDWSNKGASLVRVQNPNTSRIYNIVFTHLQANGFADSPVDSFTTEESRVRRDQLIEMKQMIKGTLGEHLRTEDLIILGDFNIDGDILYCDNTRCTQANRLEYQALINVLSSIYTEMGLGGAIIDAWDNEMSSPNVPFEKLDRGSSSDIQIPFNDPVHKRCDFILHCSPPGVNHNLVSHYTPLAFELRNNFLDLSDHYGVKANLNIQNPYCNPAQSLLVNSSAFENGYHNYRLSGNSIGLGTPEAYQWFLIKEPGTYSVSIPDNEKVEFKLFSSTNLSAPIAAYRDQINDIPVAPNEKISTSKFVVLEGPFFIQIHAKKENSDFTGAYSLFIHKAFGLSEDDPIVIYPNYPSEPLKLFSSSVSTGPLTRWFSFNTEHADNHEVQTISFDLKKIGTGDEPGGTVNVNIKNPDGTLTSVYNDLDRESSLTDANIEDKEIILELNLNEPIDFTYQWNTNLCVLFGMLNEKSKSGSQLRCVSENDAFTPVDDDIVLLLSPTKVKCYPDSKPAFRNIFLGDYDEGEVKLTNSIFDPPIRLIIHASDPGFFLFPIIEENDYDDGTDFTGVYWKYPSDTDIDFLVGKSLIPIFEPTHPVEGNIFNISVYLTLCDQDSGVRVIPSSGLYQFSFNYSHGLPFKLFPH
jgi:endonuclease/exonuclease/phosphatase family metal-dependent hydrolase